ncbi:MAG: hypothetical protein V4597_01665, partial [Pseudomonadota bacterium]
MTQPVAPFAIVRPLAGPLDALLTYWQGLRRGAAEIPFWDDVDLTEAQRLGGEVFLLDVFAQPERFRFSILQQGVPRAEQEAMEDFRTGVKSAAEAAEQFEEVARRVGKAAGFSEE